LGTRKSCLEEPHKIFGFKSKFINCSLLRVPVLWVSPKRKKEYIYIIEAREREREVGSRRKARRYS